MSNHDEIFRIALERFNHVILAAMPERQECLIDMLMMFQRGYIWAHEANSAVSKLYDDKPRPEINQDMERHQKLLAAFAANPMSVQFVAEKGGQMSLTDIATFAGLFRADEEASFGRTVYKMMYEYGLVAGYAAYRFYVEADNAYTPYYGTGDEAEEDYKNIRFEAIQDPYLRVFYDPSSTKPDRSDAKFLFVLTQCRASEFKLEVAPSDFTTLGADVGMAWELMQSQYGAYNASSEDETRLFAEYYVKEEKNETIVYVADPMGEVRGWRSEEFEEKKEELLTYGFQVKSRRKLKVTRIHKYILSGDGVVADEGYIPGNRFPVAEFYPMRVVLGGVEIYRGHYRNNRDVHLLMCAVLGKMCEETAKANSGGKLMVAADAANKALDDAIRNDALYLPIAPQRDPAGNPVSAGYIGHTPATQSSPQIVTFFDTLQGIAAQQSGSLSDEERVAPNTSGELHRLQQVQRDMTSALFASSFADTLAWGAKIWMGMASDVYAEEGRRVPVVNEKAGRSYAILKETVIDPESGALLTANDFSRPMVHVQIEQGGMTKSVQQEATDRLMALLQIIQNPEWRDIASMFLMANVEGVAMEPLARAARKQLVMLGVLEPNEDEHQELEQMSQQQQQPSANDQYLAAAAKTEEAKQQKLAADVEKTLADAQLSHVKAAEVVANMGQTRDNVNQ